MIPLQVAIFRSRAAIVNVLLIIINVLAFLHELTLPPRLGRALVYTFGLVPAHEQLLFARHGISLPRSCTGVGCTCWETCFFSGCLGEPWKRHWGILNISSST
jgi:hypothetical protein